MKPQQYTAPMAPKPFTYRTPLDKVKRSTPFKLLQVPLELLTAAQLGRPSGRPRSDTDRSRTWSKSILPIVSIVVPVWGLPYRILIIYLVKPEKGTTMETLGKT